MPEKRPYPGGGNPESDNKRPKSNNASPAQGSKTSSATTPANINEQLEAAKAKARAMAKAKAAAAKERVLGMSEKLVENNNTPVQPQTNVNTDRASRLAALKARINSASSRSTDDTSNYARQPTKEPSPAPEEDAPPRQRGGLGIGLHPSLMEDVNQETPDKKGNVHNRFATVKGNRAAEAPIDENHSDSSAGQVSQNPYLDNTADVEETSTKARKPRQFNFHQKGKFVTQAANLRRQAHLEEMKRRIAESAKKAELEEDRTEHAFLIAEPPLAEWWDEGLVDGDTYPAFDENPETAMQRLKLDTQDSLITQYIQHPVLITAPRDKIKITRKPMYLTKTEQAKRRRQERAEGLKEKQAKIRLGLEPPEPPKVKKSNMMRVLGEEAVKDPTAVEARVNREIAERRQKHEDMNAERQLTKEQQREKLVRNQENDAAKGIVINAYRVNSLVYGKHRALIEMNAKEHNLTGIAIYHPEMNLVIVEGGAWALKKYQKLMLRRVKWTEIAEPKEKAEEGAAKKVEREIPSWLQVFDDDGNLRDQSGNQCVLIFEGEEKQRSFRKWSTRICETDVQARMALGRGKYERMWTLAKNWSA